MPETKQLTPNQPSADDRTASKPPPPPMLRVTRYDQVSSFMVAIVLGLIIAVLVLGVIWATNRPTRSDGPVPLELIDLPGGDEDGAENETLELESPEEETQDPSLVDEVQDEPEVQEVIENVIELADEATSQAQQQFQLDAQNAGKPGSASGNGRRPLGQGGGESGFPREQRWFVRFSERGTLDEYADQLDFFGIELGALLPGGKMIYLSRLKDAKPTQRSANSGANENRLYMTWQGGGRKQGDLLLFKKAGINVAGGVIFHFYSRTTETLLAKLEGDYRKRKPDEIRRTYFVVRRAKSGFEFLVTRQTYLK